MKVRYLCTLAVATLLLAGCSWEPLPPPDAPPAERVFLMYDNIGSWFDDDVAEAGAAIAAGMLESGDRVVVFHRRYRVEGQTGNRSVIYELVRDASQSNGYRKEMLRVYDSGVNASLSPGVIASVVGDIRNAVPAPHYGLAFGSHGKGWVPKVNPVGLRSGISEHDSFAQLWQLPEKPLTRYFSSDSGEKLDVSEFIDALDEWAWDFIILDDCFMASVEALYDMRTLADYIIASPTEIMQFGFPYDRIVNTLFNDWSESGFKQAGMEYVDYYENLDDYPYGTIAVINMSQLDALAARVRAIRIDGFRNPDAATAASMQTYEGMTTHYYYDFNQYIDYWSLNRSLYEQFAAQLERTVIYKGHTEKFPTAFPSQSIITPIPISPEHYSGINAFIPTSATARMTSSWQQTEWYKVVYVE